MNTLRGLIADFRALHAKLNREKWVTYRDPVFGNEWLPMYNSSGHPMASLVQFQYREPIDMQFAIDGDLEAARARGVARKRVATMDDITSGLISRQELCSRESA